MTTLVASMKPKSAAAIAAAANDTNADFDRRWAAWEAAGLRQERATRRHMAWIAIGAAVVGALILVFTLLG